MFRKVKLKIKHYLDNGKDITQLNEIRAEKGDFTTDNVKYGTVKYFYEQQGSNKFVILDEKGK